VTLSPSGSGGNPYLNPIKSSDYDASLEWYFKPGSLLSAAAFYRKINGYIETFAANEVINGKTYSISKPRNTGNGRLQGVELAYTNFFTSLPGWLSGFGTQLNGTLISAKTHSPSGQMQDVVNVSKYSYNAVLIYQKDKLSARLAYNWRSKYASSFNQSGDQPPSIYFGPTHRLDLALNYDLDKNLTLALDARNLLGNTTRDYFGTSPYLYPRDVINSERTYSLGVRFNF
jgi:TonB-dependent receptor